MARGEKIALNDLMLRHLRTPTHDAALTMTVGTTSVADARRQVVLKTFASTNGDLARTAKIAGLSVDEVRNELLSLLDGGASTNGSGPAAALDSEARIARKTDNIAAARGAAKGKPPKKK